MTTAPLTDAAAGTFTIGGDLTVRRLGFGAMRITGNGVWGDPPDLDVATRVLRRADELGVNLIDTADSYGPEVSEGLIAEALHPYPDDLVIATKGGFVRPGPNEWRPDCRPAELKQACEGSLERLRLERIDIYQLHTVDKSVPYEDSVGALVELQREGKIRHIGVSNVDARQLARAQAVAAVVTVQNMYNLSSRRNEDVLDACARDGLGFIPWYPLATGDLARPGSVVAEIAEAHDVPPAHVALAWLLQRAPVVLPIPGTGSVAHLDENVGAAGLRLSDDELVSLLAAGR
ncbi:MAG: aldo/keto reductase [Acidimicrobiia bacterium]|nr:aldo/keto reductase [Acidimicrobiia bacterium]